jgi:hypothetical protein
VCAIHRKGENLVAILDDLRTFDVEGSTVSLWVFKGPRGASDADPTYTGHWVETTDSVDAVLKETVSAEIARIEEINQYALLAENNEASALQIAKDETFADIVIEAVGAETENKRVQKTEQLRNTTFYLIKMVNTDIILYAVRRTSTGWKTKRAVSARTIIFDENQLDLDDRPRFDLEKNLDFFVFDGDLLILHKGHFESILRYKEAHASDFLALQAEAEFAGIFVDLAPLVQYVGKNKIHLRRMSAVRKKGYYRDAEFMNRLRQRHTEYGFTFQFDEDGQIIPTAETSSQIITALLDHRLKSEFSRHIYDVPSTTQVPI